jgi:hypothetical protein
MQDPVRRKFLALAVKEMEEKAETVHAPDPGFYSRIFLVPKFLGPQICVLPYVVCQFEALPFGLNTAPQVFTKVAAPIAAYAHLHGISIHLYLDDWLINPSSREDSASHTSWILQLCSRLGWVVNLEKSDLIPTQVATYLGIKFDSLAGLAYPSDKRIENWVAIAKGFVVERSQTALSWLRLLGHLVSLEKLVPYGRLRIRAVQQQLSLMWNQSSDHQSMMVPIDSNTISSILWWLDLKNLRRGVSMGVTQVNYYLYTDSSSMGWGAHLLHHTASGTWSNSMKESHINVLELMAIWLGLQAFVDTIRDSNVAIMCDNVSAIAYLRNQGGTLSRQMSDLALQVCMWAELNHVTLIPRHLPGHLNVLADQLSRKNQILTTEWSLHQTVADKVFLHWGKPTVDLFALKCNSKLAIYMSPVLEPETWKVDSLVQSWQGLYAYAYPPTTLIRATLSKLIADKPDLILIAPLWPHQEWFPDLIKMSIDFPLELPVVPKLLKQLFSHIFH